MTNQAKAEGFSADTRIRLFQDTVARPLNGKWYLMNRPDLGWGERAMEFPSLRAIADRFAVQFGLRGNDVHGPYCTVKVIPAFRREFSSVSNLNQE